MHFTLNPSKKNKSTCIKNLITQKYYDKTINNNFFFTNICEQIDLTNYENYIVKNF